MKTMMEYGCFSKKIWQLKIVFSDILKLD